MITFRPATIADSEFIARGFHTAMLYEDVPEEQIRVFAEHVCCRMDVLYSWCHTIIAEVDGEPAGMLTSYEGSHYRHLHATTESIILEQLGTSFPGMEDETVPGEYYLDSLAVLPAYRGRGIGRALLKEGIRRGQSLSLRVTLAVDPVNEKAQHLYASLGFRPAGSLFIFGHTYWKMAIDNSI